MDLRAQTRPPPEALLVIKQTGGETWTDDLISPGPGDVEGNGEAARVQGPPGCAIRH
jgi:hypothetical protein